MNDRRQPEREILPEALTAKVLKRASELDAAQRAGSRISELRAAATEAGISPNAFDAALAEVQEAESAPMPAAYVKSRRRRGMLAIVAAFALLFGVGTLAVGLVVVPATVPFVEQAFRLRCLSTGQAAELLRPLLDGTGTIKTSPTQAPGVLTVRATPEQMAKVRAELDKYEGAGAPSCPTSP